MQNFKFDIQRFTAVKAFASAAKAVGSSAKKIADPDGLPIFVGNLYDSAKSLIGDDGDIKNGNISAGTFEAMSGIISTFERIMTKLEIPFLGLASSMAKLEASIQRAQKEKPLSNDTRDELVTNFIDFIGEGVKAACFCVVPGGVAARFVASNAFGVLVNVVTTNIKAVYLAIVNNEQNFVSAFIDEWFGGLDDIFKDVIKFFRGEVTSADYSEGVIKIVDDEGNISYYNETNGIRLNLPNDNNRVSNYAYDVTINGGSKNDTIYSKPNSDNSATQGNSIIGGSGKDFIVAYEDNSTIDGGVDDDRIAILGKKNKIRGGEGTDAILLENGANGNTIDGGRGNDYIILEDGVKNAIILYTEGDGNDIIVGYDESDEIRILADYSASINGQDVIIGVGNDSITLNGAAGKEININGTKQKIGSKPTNPPLIIALPSVWHESTKEINYTNGNDTIDNILDNLIINALAGRDDITNSGNNVTINGSKGNDYITNSGTNVVVNNGIVIQNIGSNVTINNGYSYNQSITNSGSNVEINGGETVKNTGSSVTISSDYGDAIYNSGDSVSIDAGDSKKYIYNSSDHVTIDCGKNKDTICNFGSNTTIYSGAGDDSIKNLGSNVLILSNDGDDTISNGRIGYYDKVERNGEDITISSGFGSDSIENLSNNVSISSGEGNDTIYNWGSSVTIDGGDGNDSIYNGNGTDQGIYVKINAEAGNDTIRNNSSNVIFQYNIGDDNDLIYGFNETSTLQIIGANYSSVKSDYDIILTIGEGKITLKGVAGLATINIVTLPSDTTPTAFNLNNVKSNTLVTGSEYDDTIGNDGSNVTINGGTGDDTITNNGARVLIDGGSGTDIIKNLESNVTINGVSGEDDIWNYADAVKINGGADDDYIVNFGNNVTVSGDTDNDFIYNNGSNVSFKYTNNDGNDIIEGFNETSTLQIGDGNGTYSSTVSGEDIIVTVGNGKITLKDAATLSTVHIDGKGSTVPTAPLKLTTKISHRTITGTSYNDSVWNEGDYVTIDTASGNDSVVNIQGDNVLINVGNGNDYVCNAMSSYVTINTSEGSDTINNVDFGFTKISTGEDNDSIYSFSDYTTINAGAGNDMVSLNSNGGHNVIEYASGDGNDIIYDIASTDTLSITNGKWFSVTDTDNNVLVNVVGSGTITLSGAKGKDFNIEGEKLTFITVDDHATIEFEDFWMCHLVLYGSHINNSKNAALITGTDYNDTIKNTGNTIFVSVGSGQDSVYNTGYALIDAGQGNDTVTNYGDNSKILGGNGNDSIYNRASGVFIYGDEGNDNIYFSGQSSYILGEADNDSIYVTGSGNRVYAGNGDDTITLNSSAIVATIEGGIGNDVINNKGIEQTFLYTAGDGNDIITGFNASSTLQVADGKGTYSTVRHASDIIVTVGEGKITLVGAASLSTVNIVGTKKVENSWKLDGTRATYGNLITVSGVKSLDGISLSGTTVTVKGSSLNKTNVTISEGYTLSLENDAPKPSTSTAAHFDGLTYKSASSSEGYFLSSDKKSISYIPPVNETNLFSLTNVKNTDSIEVDTDKKTVTLKANNLIGKNVSITGDYLLKLGNDVPTPSTKTAGSFTKFASGIATFTTNSGIFYTLDRNKINYAQSSGSKSITIKGLKKDLSLSGGKINGITATYSNGITIFKIKESALAGGDVTLTGNDCKLELDNYATPATVPATFINGVYTQAYTPAHYSATDKKISYVKQVGGDKFSIAGLANGTGIGNGITVDAKGTVTISKNALNAETITLTNDTKDGVNKIIYKLAIDKSSVPTSSTKVKAAWSKNGNAHTYTTAYTPAYYKLSGSKLTYAKKIGGEQFTLNGLASTSGVKVSGKTVTIGKAALGNKNVTFSTSDGYKLAFDKTVTAAKEIKSGWTGKNGTFTYTTSGMTTGYQLDGDKIVFKEQIGGEQFTITGVKDTKNISVNGKVVTIGKNSLNGKNIELKGKSYTLALAADVPQSAKKNPGSFTVFSKGTAIFKTSSYPNNFYTLNGNNVIYTAQGGNDIKISNLNPNKNLAEVQSAIHISELDGNSVNISFASADVLNNKAPIISVPKGIAYTVSVDEKLSVAKQTPTWTVKSTNATLSADISATYKASGTKITCTPKKSGSAQLVLAGLVKNAKLELPDKNIVTLDATNLSTKASLKSNAGGYSIELTGNMSGKTFVGTSAADTLIVTAEKAMIQGSKGNDYFNIKKSATLIYGSGDGNDTINFAEGLTVSLSGSTEVKNISQNDSGVVLDFGKNSSITVMDIADGDGLNIIGKKQNLTVDTSKLKLAEKLTFDKTSVTIDANFTGSLTQGDDFFLGGSKLSNVTTFDASNVTIGISIEGNDQANVIYAGNGTDSLSGGKGNDQLYGGTGNDTLWGGAGNDSLWGNLGSDTFIYNKGEGKDVIYGFENNDLLQITETFSATYNNSKKEITFKVSSTASAITFKDFTATNFNINGNSYSISGTKLIKK